MGLPVNMDKLALLLIALAFQFHAICMATTGKYSAPGRGNEEKDDAIKAFMIIAFVLYLAAFILSVLINFGNLDDKIAKIITVVAAIAGVVCLLIGISIYGDFHFGPTGKQSGSFPFTIYTVGGLCEGAGAVCMLLAMCC